MSTSPYSPYPHGLPPTSNNLTPQQRTHLVHSTRKLSSVLGATPTIFEGDTPHDFQGTDPHSAVTSSSSNRCGQSPKPYLRLATTSIPHTTSPPVCATPPTPTTPSVPSETEIRRKRMAKLTRHLGENIPPDLVRVSTPEPKPSTAPLSHIPIPRTQSLHTHDVPAQSNYVQVVGRDWVGEWNRSNIQDVRRELRNLRRQ